MPGCSLKAGTAYSGAQYMLLLLETLTRRVKKPLQGELEGPDTGESGVGARSSAVAFSLTSQDLLSHLQQSLQAALRRPGLAGRWAGIQNRERLLLHVAMVPRWG